MPQPNGQSDVRLIYIDGVQWPGLLKVNEQGYDMDSIPVDEYGNTNLIASGQKKAMALELEYIGKRDGIVAKNIKSIEENGGFAGDITMYMTDKNGKRVDAYERKIFKNAELGPYKIPDFDQGSRKLRTIKFTLFTEVPETRLLT